MIKLFTSITLGGAVVDIGVGLKFCTEDIHTHTQLLYGGVELMVATYMLLHIFTAKTTKKK